MKALKSICILMVTGSVIAGCASTLRHLSAEQLMDMNAANDSGGIYEPEINDGDTATIYFTDGRTRELEVRESDDGALRLVEPGTSQTSIVDFSDVAVASISHQGTSENDIYWLTFATVTALGIGIAVACDDPDFDVLRVMIMGFR